MHGISAVLCHSKNKFPDSKYTTVCEWRKVITQKDHKVVTELEENREEGHAVMLHENMSFSLL